MLMMERLKKVGIYNLNDAYQKVIIWFFSFPDSIITLSDLATEMGISKATANRIVIQLMKEGFIQSEVIGKVWRISCNKSHNYNLTRKIIHNLRMVYEAGIIEETHKFVKNARAIILFGSYRKGDDTEKSDIDIAVEVLGDEALRILPLGIFPQLGYRKNVPVNLHIFSRKKVDLNLFSNIANGIVLDGFLEVRP